MVSLLVSAALGDYVNSLMGYWMEGWLEGHLGCNCWLVQCHHRRRCRKGCGMGCYCEFGADGPTAFV